MCHITDVTVFNFKLRRGAPIFDQVLLAAIGAILRGEYPPGQPFPSVRGIAAELKIHPNTAHKVVQHLIEEHWLEMRPGTGTVVAERSKPPGEEWRRLLSRDIERVLERARSVDVGLADLIEELTRQWHKLQTARRNPAS